MWRDERTIFPSRYRSRVALFAGTILTASIFLLLALHTGVTTSWKKTVTTIAGYAHKPTSLTPAELHILVPANKKDANLCKVILATTVLAYPIPTLYNWEATGEPMMAKITGATDYIQALDASHDEDLVLIMDGFDEWVQVPPKVLIDRYHNINDQANTRLLEQLGEEIGRSVHIDQRIVFASQKRCWPGVPGDVKCAEAYESPLPRDVYGSLTDQHSSDPRNEYLHMRQKYLNAGFILGRAKDLRLLWKRAEEKAEEDPNCVGHDQNVFARIWGEQNHQRRSPSSFTSSPSIKDRHQKRNDNEKGVFPFVPVANKNYEFGLGLDYASSLSLPTVFSEYDADWFTFSNRSSIEAVCTKNEISSPGVDTLDKDIAAEELPFRHLANSTLSSSNLSAKATWYKGSHTRWEDVPLFTHLWTGITPAIIHHNAHRDNLKKRRHTTWDKMWFQPFARELVQQRLDSAAPTISQGHPGKERLTKAELDNGKDGAARRVIAIDKQGREWYAPAANDLGKKGQGQQHRWGVRTIGGAREEDGGKGIGKGGGKEGWLTWGELCDADAQQEVFRDGKGVWEAENKGST